MFKEFCEGQIKYELRYKWTSPGGEKKHFTADKVVISWWKNKKCLAVNGKKARGIVHTLLTFIDNSYNVNTTELVSGEDKKPTCPCRCGGVQTDIEGMKLDLVIAEARIKANEVMIPEIRQNNEVIISEIRQEINESLNKLKSCQNKTEGDEVDLNKKTAWEVCNGEQPHQSRIEAISERVSSLQRDMEAINKCQSQERDENYNKLSSSIRSSLRKIEDVIEESVLKGECPGSITSNDTNLCTNTPNCRNFTFE